MKLNVYNAEGKVVKDVELSDDIFGVKIKPEVVHQVFVQMTANQREPWAHTKDRGDVRGGGKKPWAQKGTGRARHGSSRSPIWVGGGVTFGPTNERSYKTKINKKTRRLATKMCLSDKAGSNGLLVVENLSFAEPKTKLFAGLVKALPTESRSFLVLTGEDERAVLRMTNNLPKVKTVRAEDVNVMDLLGSQTVIASEAALKKIEEIYKK